MSPSAAALRRPLAAGAVTALVLLTALLPAFVLPGSAAAATVPVPAGPGGLTLQLDQMTPRVVTADGPATVTVSGTLRNTGDRPVDDLEVRLQRGDTLRTDGDVRDALAGAGRMDVVAPAFVALPGVLDPGVAVPVQLNVPLRGAPQDGLAFTRPGVYMLLVNVNGVPRDGVRARLAAVRLLLPVLSLPAGAGPGAPPAVPAPAAPAPSGPPADVTVLYPVTDAPRRLPTVPGEPAQLTDDDLARSFAPDGRLGGLVAAFADRAPPGSAVRAATCLAVDPDLVATAVAMRQGYLVRAPDGTTTQGTGALVAGTWLTALASAARGGCVVALPFADADLAALADDDLADLGRLAVATSGATVAETLGTPVVAGTTWPADGTLDAAAVGEVAAAGERAVVVGADTVEGDPDVASSGVVTVTGAGSSSMLAVLADPLLSRAAAGGPFGTATDGAVPDRVLPGAPTSTDAGASPPLSTQDVLAALVFRTQAPPPGAAPIVLAPPHTWTADATGARALLDAVDLLIGSGRLAPRGLADVVSAGPDTSDPQRRLTDPLQADTADVAAPVRDAVRQMRADVVDLQSAAVAETGVGASLDATFTPLLQAALRPTSAAWRGRPELATAAATAASARIATLRDSVRVLPPPTPYSLGTRNAPLLLTVANGLPVTVEVRLSISSTTGLRVAPIPAQRIPPLGRRQVQVDAQVVRSGQFVVEAMVRTAAGRQLGPPSRLLVRSTAYGTITVWLTGCAGVLLVVLAAIRVVRRVRGEPSRRDRVGPPAGPAPVSTSGVAPGATSGSTLPEPAPRPPPATPRPTPPGTRAGSTADGLRSGGPGRPGAADVPGHGRGPGAPDPTGPGPARPPARGNDRSRAADATGPGPPVVTGTDRSSPAAPPPAGSGVGEGGAREGRRRGPSLGRASGLMAIASLVSRVTGFLRQLALVTVLGLGVVNDSYTVANTLPNIVYELLLGGVLTSVMVPLLVRAQTEDADGGEGYTRRLLTVAGAALALATLAAMIAAPLLTRLYLGDGHGPANPELATAFAWLLLPQIFFYGLGALLGALLNTRGVFGPFAWAPVLNNVVVLGVLVVFVAMPGRISLDPVRMGDPKLLVLGVGTTLGIVAQALVMLPAVRRTGFRYRPLWGWDRRLGETGGLALWVVGYVLIGQVGYIVTTRVAAQAAPGSVAIYANAWLLLQVPYGVLGVSLLTALMPRMSRSAAEGRTADVIADLALGTRLSAVVLLPVSALLTVFGTTVGVALFSLGAGAANGGAARLGTALAASAFGLLPFAMTMLQLRVFYALTDSRTPTLLQLMTVGVKIPLLLAAPFVLPPERVVFGLAAANALSFVVGAALGQVLLHRRLGRLGTATVLGALTRMTVASVLAGLAALGVARLVEPLLGGLGPVAQAWVELAVAAVVGVSVAVAMMVALRVPELAAVRRRPPRRGDGA